jgi:Family of unknown function (DUF6318)
MIDRGIGRCRRGSAAGLAATVVLSLGLGGCDDDNGDPADSGLPSGDEVTETASTSPPTYPTPTPTEPETPEPPTIPDAATKAGRAGAKAFVRFYIDLENYAKDTGDVEPLQQYSHPQCGGCSDYVKFYREWYARGGWFKDGDRMIRSFERVVPAASPHDIYVRMSGHTKASTYRERRGAKSHRTQGSEFTYLVWLLRESGGWQVSRLDTPQ